jgi:uncharacterized protein YcfL
MKTLIKKLNLGILIIGLVILTSCGSNPKIVTEAGINIVQRTFPSMATSVTKYTGIKISQYLKNSIVLKNENKRTAKNLEKAGRSRKVKPISIGVSGARLDSSNSL